MKWLFAVLILGASVFSWALAFSESSSASIAARFPESNRVTAFEIHECFKEVCIFAAGPFASVSSSADAISAANVRLEQRVGKRLRKTYRCESFRYNLRTGFLMCDNELVQEASVTVDSDFKLTVYPARTSAPLTKR